MARSRVKPKKMKQRLAVRRQDFDTSPGIRDAISKHPGSYTKPGSYKK